MPSPASPRIIAAVEALPLRKGMRVLEIGCGSREQIARGKLAFRVASAEEFALLADEAHFQLAFALRVGAFDGRHPRAGATALPRIAAALVRGGRMFIDGGNPLRELQLGAAAPLARAGRRHF